MQARYRNAGDPCAGVKKLEKDKRNQLGLELEARNKTNFLVSKEFIWRKFKEW